MDFTLQPVLSSVKGTPDFLISTAAKYPDELFVFLGMALLERVPRFREHIAFKMLLARLYNAGVVVRLLVECFGVAHTTLRRWGLALKSGDLERITEAFSGQGAPRKVTPEIERYVRDRYQELHGECGNYSRQIRAEVARYFKVRVSGERLRWIFKEEREKLADLGGGEDAKEGTQEEPAESQERANSWAAEQERPHREEIGGGIRNYSLRSGEMVGSGEEVSEHPVLYHHAGEVLFSAWLDEVTGDLREHRDIIRQWFAQVLQGAVNHEQSKRLAFRSLDFFVGPTIRSLNYQRDFLKDIATHERTLEMLERNGGLLNVAEERVFYYDPHVKQYTGVLKILKGWCGSLGGITKVMNMDFIHTQQGAPCFVQHYDNYYDMRERFFICRAAFLRIMGQQVGSLTRVIDRGVYSLQALRQLMETGDRIITWERGYAGDGWDEGKESGTFVRMRPRNRADDLLVYRFEWQAGEWARDSRIQRIVVRAVNPKGNQIEVAILASGKEHSTEQIIGWMFSRWLQENDFWYLDTHFGVKELTSRAKGSYDGLAEQLTDRQVESREHKEVAKQKRKVDSRLAGLLFKREKQERQVQKKKEASRESREGLEGEYRELDEQLAVAGATGEDAQKSCGEILRKRQRCARALERMRAKETKEQEASEKKRQQLEEEIEQGRKDSEEVEEKLLATIRDESRLQALIEEQYWQLDSRRKAFMDAIRLSSRNIFYSLLNVFRPMYNNYRDDHVVLRELTRSMGLVEKRDGLVIVQLLPAMEFPPKIRRIVKEFLKVMSEQINEHFAGRYLPICIELASDQPEAFVRRPRE
jgi:hypothetical protein